MHRGEGNAAMDVLDLGSFQAWKAANIGDGELVHIKGFDRGIKECHSKIRPLRKSQFRGQMWASSTRFNRQVGENIAI